MKQFFGLMSLVLVMLAVTACGGYGAPKATPTPAPVGGTSGEVTVTARYAAFQPSSITVIQGQTIRLKITSADIAHTFTVDELGLNISVGAGQTVTRDIKVDKSGTFTFYCSVPGHRSAGMHGTLKVGQ